jgi:DNA polymerase-1
MFERHLRDPNVLIVGQYVAYDMGVCAAAWPDLIPHVFAAYRSGRVTDTKIREQLWDIASGDFRGYPDEKGVWRKNSYDLDSIARRRAGMSLKKDGWRLRYGEFIDIPVHEWPERAAILMADAKTKLDAGVKDKDLEAIVSGRPEEVIEYPKLDAEATLRVYLNQEHARRRQVDNGGDDPFVDEFRQARSSWWCALMSAWGIRTRLEGVQYLAAMTEREIQRLTGDLVTAGLVREDGSRDTKLATQRMLDVMGWAASTESEEVTYTKIRDDARPLRKTKGGGISLDRDACKESEDPILIDYGDRAQLKAVQDKDIPMLMGGVYMPVHSRFDIVASGRKSSSRPNIQNLRRIPGIREAFVARPGKVFGQADYPQLELRTLAQCCYDLLGHSRLGDMINRGEDPHLAFAAELLHITYDEAKKNKKRHDVDAARQVGKVFNFGSPGGLGAEKLVLFARKTYGVTITVDEAKAYKRAWLETFPEMVEFFAHVSRLTDNPRKEATVKQLRSNRIRGGCTYTAACNTYFQGLGADATTDAGFELARACYADPTSILFGSRTVAYVHDEFLLELDDDARAHDKAHEMARIMKDTANRWIPACPFTEVEPLLMRVWSKEAEPLHVDGRLVPWEPALATFIGIGKALRARDERKAA